MLQATDLYWENYSEQFDTSVYSFDHIVLITSVVDIV